MGIKYSGPFDGPCAQEALRSCATSRFLQQIGKQYIEVRLIDSRARKQELRKISNKTGNTKLIPRVTQL